LNAAATTRGACKKVFIFTLIYVLVDGFAGQTYNKGIGCIIGKFGGETVDQKIRVKVIDPENGVETYIYPKPGENLLDAMARCGIPAAGECGGAGICGKCIVKVTEGTLKITSADKYILSEDMLSMGYRLACRAYPDGDCTLMPTKGARQEYKVVTESIKCKEPQPDNPASDKTEGGYAVAVDLGTTTLVLVLVDMATGNILKKYTAANPQRLYGADVISRIKASGEGKGDILKSLIRNELFCGIRNLVREGHISLSDIDKIVIAGNTTMIHLLMGYPCESLGTYPFTPYKRGFICSGSDELFGIPEKIPVIMLPAVSAFVGGDITAGLLACGFDNTEKPCLFIDLGTNGELALGNKDRILVTSASAGPAFEGGNISCGVGSIPGAICHVSISDGKISYETINGLSPTGLCGTGVIELVSQLLKEGIIDHTGLFIDDYFDKGFCIDGIRFIQEDIRSLQLAKAAIRAGIEILLKNYGISYEGLDRVYIGGGFGYYLDINKAADIGLLPRDITGKTKAAGNTALAGAVLASTDFRTKDRMEHIVSVSKEIHLSDDTDFNDLFIKHISF